MKCDWTFPQKLKELRGLLEPNCCGFTEIISLFLLRFHRTCSRAPRTLLEVALSTTSLAFFPQPVTRWLKPLHGVFRRSFGLFSAAVRFQRVRCTKYSIWESEWSLWSPKLMPRRW